MTDFPWLSPYSHATPTPEESLRFQVEAAQSEEIARLRLVNEFLRSEAPLKSKAVSA